MQKVQYLGETPVDVDGFPKNIERTQDGAIHFHPQKVYLLSDDEMKFIKKDRKDLKFVDLPIVETKKATAKDDTVSKGIAPVDAD